MLPPWWIFSPVLWVSRIPPEQPPPPAPSCLTRFFVRGGSGESHGIRTHSQLRASRLHFGHAHPQTRKHDRDPQSLLRARQTRRKALPVLLYLAANPPRGPWKKTLAGDLPRAVSNPGRGADSPRPKPESRHPPSAPFLGLRTGASHSCSKTYSKCESSRRLRLRFRRKHQIPSDCEPVREPPSPPRTGLPPASRDREESSSS